MSARLSDTWKTAEEYERDGCYAAPFWRSIPFAKLEELVAGLRSPNVPCHANRQRYALGTYAVVIELQFEDSEVWVARLRVPVDRTGLRARPEVVARETESEVATMKYVRERTTIPVPTVFSYSPSRDNDLGAPFIIMSAVQGCHPPFFRNPTFSLLRNNNLPEHIKPVVNRYICGLVDYYLQLSKLRFERIGSLYLDPNDSSKYIVGCFASSGLGPFDSAWDYYTAHAEMMEDRLLALVDDPPEAREGRALVLWLYRLGLASLSSGLDNRGPFLLAHTDLHEGNTLVDKDGNITAVLDWQAGFVPVEEFATQMLNWTTDPSIENGWVAHLHGMFSSALGASESYDDVTPALPSGRTLRAIHSSATAYLVGRLVKLLDGPDLCSEILYADRVSTLVLGLEDPSFLKHSILFREWFDLSQRRAKSALVSQGRACTPHLHV